MVNLCGRRDGLMASSPNNSTVQQSPDHASVGTPPMTFPLPFHSLWRPCGHAPFTRDSPLSVTVASGPSLLVVASTPARLWWVRRGDAFNHLIHAIGALRACLTDSACASCLSFFSLFRRCPLQLRFLSLIRFPCLTNQCSDM